MDEFKLAEYITTNKIEHDQFKEYFTNDRETLKTLTENTLRISTSVAELAATQKMMFETQNRILDRKPFFETRPGYFVLGFMLLVVAGLFYAAFHVNVLNLADVDAVKAVVGE